MGVFKKHAGRFRNGVRHAEEVCGEIVRKLYLVAAFDRDHVHLRRVRKIFLPLFNDGFRDGGRVDRGIAELCEDVRQAADVVVVAVRQDDRRGYSPSSSRDRRCSG